ncbi:MAG: RHS repeat-associated core domain-containing protein [Thermoguttaceae bacterium]
MILGNSATVFPRTYDRAGNMTESPRPPETWPGEGGRTLVYDAWNRLVAVNNITSISVVSNMAYRYDAMNRRIRRTTITVYTTTYPTSESFYDDYYAGQQLIESRIEGDPTEVLQYVWSPRYIDAPILRDTSVVEPNAAETPDPLARLVYLGDANYNVTGLLCYNSMDHVWYVDERYTYTPYGQVEYRDITWESYQIQASERSNTTLYTGRTLDPITGLYDYRARHYDPALERFINRDPIGYKGGMNLYQYVGDNPVIRTDPSGEDAPVYLRPIDIGSGVIGSDLPPFALAMTGGITPLPYQVPSPLMPIKWRDCGDTVTIISSRTTAGDLEDWEDSGIGGNIYSGARSPGDIASILEARPQEKSACGCIKTLNLSGHGWGGTAGISLAPGGADGINSNTSCSILNRIAKTLCKDATVNLEGCQTASNSQSLQSMATVLGHKVCGCTGNVSGANKCDGQRICANPPVKSSKANKPGDGCNCK